MSTPQKMFDSMKKRMEGQAGTAQQPGTTATAPVTGTGTVSAGLGKMSEKYETGGSGSGAVGWDKVGGTG